MLTGESPGGHYWWCHPHVALRPHLRRPAMIETMPETTTAQIQTPLVHQPRQAAEELTGCRVQVPDSDTGSDHVRVHLPLPEAVAPSLSHVAVAIDAAAGQAAARHLSSRSTAIRTLSLNAQLTAPLTAGGWLRVVGRPRALQGRSILASTEVFDSAGDLVALGTCRFVVVDQPRSGSPGAAPEALNPLAIPESWDAALGLGAAVSEGIPSSGEPMTVRPAAPEATTNNGASMVHGGVLVRTLELGMHSALGVADADPQSVLHDVAVVYHRPVPLGADAGVQAQSRVRRAGRTVSVAAASLVGPEERLLTTAEGIFGRFGA